MPKKKVAVLIAASCAMISALNVVALMFTNVKDVWKLMTVDPTATVGEGVGASVGEDVGPGVGDAVTTLVAAVGEFVGCAVGGNVGCLVGERLGCPPG